MSINAFDSLPHIRVFSQEPSVNEALKVLDNTSDDVLMEKDKTSGATLLFFAAQRKKDEEALILIKYLTEKRKVCIPSVVDFNGQTALFFAARDGNTDSARYLIAHGCDPQLLDNAGQSALFYACRDGRIGIVKLLLEEYGVEINQQDKVGQTALFYAARDGQLPTVKYMLKMGADPSIRDWQKKTAAAYAQKKGHYDLAAYLKSDRANVKHVKRKSSGKGKHDSSTETRHKYLLQYQAEVGDGIWLFATGDKLAEFESAFPQVAAWDPNAPAPDAKLTDAFRDDWCREALSVVDIVSKFQDGWFFQRPVDTKTWNCPDYYTIIKEPRDFTMIRKNLKSGAYVSIHTFVRDMELVFLNCFKYNSENTEVHAAGKRVQAFCRSVFEEKHIARWVQRENDLVEFLKANNLPVYIGPAAAAEQQAAQQQAATEETPSYEAADSAAGVEGIVIESEDSRTAAGDFED
eukprot:Gregarina_sp_Pseudo_9__190@NODE_1124_length_1857_cov_33_200770_g1051_i0_p1_GENE_NODE_1124_length_1857_cov_33_200770_g1051_i0NODE_1124_length_1857_cov_33_200770_g1051_i0_p1_ORF_typecomplete_len463_score75_95Ank_2/PF12796_7/2_1e10Ank_2/PF12796_7/3_9e16Ank_2/PF12796_7/1_2e16Ank_2/PF12796_7/5_6e12Ank_4/PF13637_6/9_5e02Ank_4/PF13637_6/0_42Ank_4/PF13637_6/1_8e13Ank_4/PF13637_6/2_5e12Ank_4/PF13637_6/4_3e09Ank_5/PF13857_6/1_3e02Ank_5/PF13857_6/2_7e10Ank_5/PF13857_6/1_5e05Ank_5/PF13857_6/3e12Ank_5/PF1385